MSRVPLNAKPPFRFRFRFLSASGKPDSIKPPGFHHLPAAIPYEFPPPTPLLHLHALTSIHLDPDICPSLDFSPPVAERHAVKQFVPHNNTA